MNFFCALPDVSADKGAGSVDKNDGQGNPIWVLMCLEYEWSESDYDEDSRKNTRMEEFSPLCDKSNQVARPYGKNRLAKDTE